MIHRSRQMRNAGGFTLIELMIVVAIIGVLSSVAVPSFINYQLTSKRAEAYSNLGALATAQKAFFAEYNKFVPSLFSWPAGDGGELPHAKKRDISPLATSSFADVGWTPEGDVFFDYDTATPDDPMGASCDCAEACFTASAYGDLDGNGLQSTILFVHPDLLGDACESGYNMQSVPTDPVTGLKQFDMPARSVMSDRY